MEAILAYYREHTWVVETFLIILATGVLHLVAKSLLDRLERQSEKTANVYDDAFVHALRRPLSVGIYVFGISFASQVIATVSDTELFQHIPKLRDVSVVVLLSWFALRFVKRVEILVIRDERNPADTTTVKAISKLLRASVLITCVLLVLEAFGFSISGVLAFGGIGGIAVGFAARDLLANFFGALMIFLDRPFSVGDWVRSPDQEIEGTVEEIGWRLTRIRTFDKRPLYVPNSVFTNVSVENPSRMLNRRIYETVGIRYDDVAEMASIVADVKAMLSSHDAIDQRQTLMVNFVEFGPSSLDFFVYCFTKTTVWAEYHEIKQDVLLRIAEIIEKHGAEIAFPTRTLHIQPEPAAG